eukprot:scaffold19717_cov60-Phaeocystis_antarctica.AAC.2
MMHRLFGLQVANRKMLSAFACALWDLGGDGSPGTWESPRDDMAWGLLSSRPPELRGPGAGQRQGLGAGQGLGCSSRCRSSALPPSSRARPSQPGSAPRSRRLGPLPLSAARLPDGPPPTGTACEGR